MLALKECWAQDTEKRPSMEKALQFLDDVSTIAMKKERVETETVDLSKTNVIRIEDIPLDFHQGAVAENAGEVAASMFQSNNEMDSQLQEELENLIEKHDGTNACAFLSVKNIDLLYSKPNILESKEVLKSEIEKVLSSLPSQINDVRDANQLSFVDDAMEILKSKKILHNNFELVELLKIQSCDNPIEKDNILKEAIIDLSNYEQAIAVYMCSPICLVIGFMNGKFFAIDSHCIHKDLGGNGNGFIKLLHCQDAKDEGGNVIFNWLKLRMTTAVNRVGPESLLHLVVKPGTSSESNQDECNVFGIQAEEMMIIDDGENEEFLISDTDDDELVNVSLERNTKTKEMKVIDVEEFLMSVDEDEELLNISIEAEKKEKIAEEIKEIDAKKPLISDKDNTNDGNLSIEEGEQKCKAEQGKVVTVPGSEPKV